MNRSLLISLCLGNALLSAASPVIAEESKVVSNLVSTDVKVNVEHCDDETVQMLDLYANGVAHSAEAKKRLAILARTLNMPLNEYTLRRIAVTIFSTVVEIPPSHKGYFLPEIERNALISNKKGKPNLGATLEAYSLLEKQAFDVATTFQEYKMNLRRLDYCRNRIEQLETITSEFNQESAPGKLKEFNGMLGREKDYERELLSHIAKSRRNFANFTGNEEFGKVLESRIKH